MNQVYEKILDNLPLSVIIALFIIFILFQYIFSPLFNYFIDRKIRNEIDGVKKETKNDIKDIRNEIKNDIKDIKNEIKDGWKDLRKTLEVFILPSLEKKFTESNSPRRLNDEGIKISKEIKDVFNTYKDILKKSMKCDDIKNNYDIKKQSLLMALNMPEYLSGDDLSKLKEVAYNYGVSIESVYIVIGYMLTDYIKTT